MTIANIIFTAIFSILGLLTWFTLILSLSRQKWPVTAILFLLLAFCVLMVGIEIGVI